MVYEISRKLAEQSYQHWISNEVFSFGWFLSIIVLAIFYTSWLILVDKSRIDQLLLIGTLASVGYIIFDIIGSNFLGLFEYKIRITPFLPTIFTVAVTIAPMIIMFAHQCTASWKNYSLWVSIGMGFLCLILLPIYTLLGIFKLHDSWNYFHHFLAFLVGAIISRVLLLWIIGIKRKHNK